MKTLALVRANYKNDDKRMATDDKAHPDKDLPLPIAARRPQFGIRKLFKNLVIRDYFCIFVCEFQLLTIYIKNKSHDYRGQNY